MADTGDIETQKIDEALSAALGLHGAWVLVTEVYDENGETTLHIFRHGPNIWTSMGLIEAAREATLERFRD
ncbi:hypothetical protein [Phycicoccus sp. 3266]|uniref:hypothetical protein n=1 Tax=Phycicoccus sp. 3266 TaxID=2817751 RepID=UPI002854E029|nr:hypothetical protein [Phycicoccus sp. 3266]MDR6861958.1 hypothetical protein [Phycicoccus sp. 3266]